MTWVAGIDGGGTSTRLQVRDAQNAVLSSAEFGPFNIASIGEQAFASVWMNCGQHAPPWRTARRCVSAAQAYPPPRPGNCWKLPWHSAALQAR